jgi:hypothetical protein
MVSNGEYMPLPQTEQQKRVEMRVRQLAEGARQQLGLSRRGFLASVGGMAASFIAMNEVFGPYFKVDPLEMLVPEAYAAGAAVAAHILGQLLKFMGPDRIVFGSDSVWFGSPQWQIDAMWRFQIPEEMQRKYGYRELTEEAKRRILGLNSARLYGIDVPQDFAARFKSVPADYATRMSDDLKRLMEMPGYTADNLARAKERYVESGAAPDHTRYGWVRTS